MLAATTIVCRANGLSEKQTAHRLLEIETLRFTNACQDETSRKIGYRCQAIGYGNPSAFQELVSLLQELGNAYLPNDPKKSILIGGTEKFSAMIWLGIFGLVFGNYSIRC